MTSWLRLAIAGGAAVAVSLGVGAGVAADDVQPVETVTIGDTVALTPPAQSPVSETATVADSVLLTPAPVIIVAEAIHMTDSTSVVVTNTAPSLSPIANATTTEGSPFSAAGSFSDPDAQTWTAKVNYGDGAGPQPLALDSSKSFQLNHVYDDNGAYTVTVTVTDSLGASDSESATVTVSNVSPQATLTNNGPVGEGSPATVSFSQQHDASQADTGAGFRYRFACDGTTLGPETTTASMGCTFDDGPSSHSALARIIDKDGGFTDYSSSVEVTNTAPDGTLSNSGPVAEGHPVTVTWSGQSDPSASDVAAGFNYQYGCDGQTLGAPTTSPTATCTFYDGPSSRTVLSRITDKDGGTTDHTTTVLVTNVSPTATFVSPAAVLNEGSTFSLALTNRLDPSAADVAAGLTVAFDCGDGLGYQQAGQCRAIDNPSQAVKARISDKDGGSTEYTGTVSIANVAPTVSITGPAAGALYQIGQPVTVTGSFTDPGQSDTHTARWSFDAITLNGSITEAHGSGTTAATYTFAQAGVYSVRLTVTDKDGGSGTASTVGGVDALVVVYDPTAGFVTGGGWIQSPAGAYLPDRTLTGKASFGFVSKYQKGANQPTGDTEFQFREAGLNFHSTSYQWLVVAGSKAQFKGTGELNGVGGFGFMLTAYDGSPDRLRMKIWDAAGNIVYDNAVGSSDDVDSANPQILGGGSIVVHR